MKDKIKGIIKNSIFFGKQNITDGYYLLNNNPTDIVITVLSVNECKEYEINNQTFHGFQWYKLVCEPDNLSMLSKYYGLIHIILKNAYENNKNVLIHSSSKQLRAGHILAVYFMLEKNWDVKTTVEFMKIIRPDIILGKESISELQKIEYNVQNYKYFK